MHISSRIHRCRGAACCVRRGIAIVAAPAALALLLNLAIAHPAAAQGPQMGPMLVRYTEARQQELRQRLTLPGTVEAQTASVVAATVSGQVIEYPAREGLRVRAGQVLARLDTGPRELQLAAQQAALREAQARLKLADRNLDRARELLEAGVISRQEFDDRQTEQSAWQGRVDSLQAEIARIEDMIARCSVLAPFAGVVVAERTQVGQWLGEGGPVVELAALGTVEVRVEVPERYFSELRAGAAAEVTFGALPGFAAQGRVVAIIPRADPQARTFPVKVRIGNRGRRIGAGMLAQVSFPVGERYSATVVPKDAVVRQGARAVLYRVNGQNVVEEVPVETGAGVGAWIEVRGALRAGDKIVTRGNERLSPGMPVQASPLAYETP